MAIFLIIVILVLSISTGFLAKELLKKFHFWKEFQKHYSNQCSWHYSGDKEP